jgi:hypothetical protein
LPPKVDGLDAVFRCIFPTTPGRVLAASLRALAREDKIMADKTCATRTLSQFRIMQLIY